MDVIHFREKNSQGKVSVALRHALWVRKPSTLFLPPNNQPLGTYETLLYPKNPGHGSWHTAGFNKYTLTEVACRSTSATREGTCSSRSLGPSCGVGHKAAVPATPGPESGPGTADLSPLPGVLVLGESLLGKRVTHPRSN